MRMQSRRRLAFPLFKKSFYDEVTSIIYYIKYYTGCLQGPRGIPILLGAKLKYEKKKIQANIFQVLKRQKFDSKNCDIFQLFLLRNGGIISKLTLSWRRSLSYRNHLLCKSVDWFLYDRDLCHERDNFDTIPLLNCELLVHSWVT